jgi:hypothetical protein
MRSGGRRVALSCRRQAAADIRRVAITAISASATKAIDT